MSAISSCPLQTVTDENPRGVAHLLFELMRIRIVVVQLQIIIQLRDSRLHRLVIQHGGTQLFTRAIHESQVFAPVIGPRLIKRDQQVMGRVIEKAGTAVAVARHSQRLRHD